MTRLKVAIFGGGLSGMTAAHHLAKAGLDVELYEADSCFGGKLQSWRDPASGASMEHGFRYYFEPYENLFRTLREIPGRDGRTVFDDLVPIGRWSEVLAEFQPPPNLLWWVAKNWRLLSLLFISEERWRSSSLIGKATSECFDEADPLIHFLSSTFQHTFATDKNTDSLYELVRFLLLFLWNPVIYRANGPTSDIVVDPWVRHLAQLGVSLHRNMRLTTLKRAGDRIVSATVRGPDGQEREVVADCYVGAIHVADWQRLLSENRGLEATVPELGVAKQVPVVWQNGVSIYLNKKIERTQLPKPNPWKLTMVLHHDGLWREFSRATAPDGAVRCIVSCCISSWDSPGRFVRKPARLCTREELLEEVIGVHVETGLYRREDVVALGPDRCLGLIDKAIAFGPNGLPIANHSPSVAYDASTLRSRPSAKTSVSNFFLASTWCDTPTSSTENMESACITGIAAARAVIEACRAISPMRPERLPRVIPILSNQSAFPQLTSLSTNPLHWPITVAIYATGRIDAALLRFRASPRRSSPRSREEC